MSEGHVVARIPDPRWGSPVVARITPSEESSWGVFEPISWHPLASHVYAVGEDVWERAILGDATPLMREMRSPPARSLAMARDSLCHLSSQCLAFSPSKCFPSKKTPECFEIPGDMSPDSRRLLSALVRLWVGGTTVCRLRLG